MNYTEYIKLAKDKFKWADEARLGGWMPFVVLPKETVTKHFVFEKRWDDPVIQRRISFELQIHTDRTKKWEKVAKWEMSLTPSAWGELTNNATSICCVEESECGITTEKMHPPDLHKYTGTKLPIPDEGFGAAPSYLDYPETGSNDEQSSSGHQQT